MNEDEVGLANLVAAEAGVDVPETPQEPQTQTPEPEAPQTPETPEQPQAPEPQTPEPVAQAENQEPSKTETETPEPIDWQQFIPKAETEVQMPQPREDGTLDPQEYENYILAKAEARLEAKNAIQTAMQRSLEKAEEILPEMKTDPKIAALVQKTATAQAVTSGQVDFIAAANELKEVLGLTKTQAENNVRTSVEIQKNAALETGSATKASEPSKGQVIADRINAGDEDAFIELIDMWQEEGVL
jgi:hypothetical protein